ncbi:MAG: MmpS family transport accessory protein [Mycobacterium sp.]|uniref:MmpS family transport accessory protein n=1 Tax=Mycobacterium sp. TaxID=1785 RepID=UPI002601E29C|nr:MmpS family transport accessory protein [Mycobacterium sp.]MDI3315974.1 MmpS family transport accessory protein [Mycobacterium sp.]
MLKVLQRLWIPLVIAAVVTVGGFAAYRLHAVFGSHRLAAAGQVEAIVPINVKRVTYEVFGPARTTGYVTYLDENAQPHGVNFTSLPWQHTLTTTLPGVFAAVVAQGNSETIGCRIVVDGRLKDEESTTILNAQTFCLDKAA